MWRKYIKQLIAFLCVMMCVLSAAITVSAEKIAINYTSPETCTYSVRKTDLDSEFYVTVIYSSASGVLMCWSQNDQNSSICSDIVSIPLSPGTMHETRNGTYRQLPIQGIYSLHLKCSLPGINVKLYYEP